MNPYQQSVIDASLAQMNRQQAQDLTNLEAQQIRSGAFGSRGEVARGEFEAANALDRNKLISELNQTGFTNAQNLTMDQIASEAGVLGTAASGLTGIGSLDTAINQAGLDAKFNEFLRQQGFDANKLSQVLGAAQGNYGGTTTATSKPGLFDYLSAAATAASSDIRLKKDITPAGKMNGVQFYTWNWNEDGEKFASHKQIKFGVIAQEIQKTHPQYVAEDSNGYLRVNYGDLVKELAA
jgi:hypothetical protein